MHTTQTALTDAISYAKILIVDDQEDNVALLERTLLKAGYRSPLTVTDSREVAALVAAEDPDLILLDLMMPHLNGFEVMARLKEVIPGDRYLPIMVLTADPSDEVRRRALAEGAVDFLTKPLNAVEVQLRTRNLLLTRELYERQRGYSGELEQNVRQQVKELAEANRQLKSTNHSLERTNLEMLNRLARAAEYRDDDTGDHTRRVGTLASRVAGMLGLGEERRHLIAHAARLHDIGKIGIPDRILLKPDRLSDEEMAIIRTHCHIGADILAGASSELLVMAHHIAMTHHERFDGSGYPTGLAGEDIPIEGRIVAVIDVFDALTHERPYKRAWTQERALELLHEERGKHFDPQVVDAFLEVLATEAALSWEHDPVGRA